MERRPAGWRDHTARGAAILACNIPAAAKVADVAACQECVRQFDAIAVVKVQVMRWYVAERGCMSSTANVQHQVPPTPHLATPSTCHPHRVAFCVWEVN
jgi:hypothetical protein